MAPRPLPGLLAPLPAASLLLLLGACASAPPSSEVELGTPIPDAFEHGDPQRDEDAGERWWEAFGDPGLDRLVPRVLERNRELAAAAARVDAALAEARIAGADLRPRVEADLNGRRSRQNFVGFPIPGREDEVLSTTSTSVGVNLSISWEADLWGRLRAGRSAAEAAARAVAADLAAARLSLAGQAAKAWFALLETREQVRLAEATLERWRLTEERIRRRYEMGLRGPLELRQATANRAGAEASLALRKRLLDTARRQLELLLSRYPRAREWTGTGSLPAVPPAPPTGLPATLLTRRPDLAAAELRLQAAGWSVAEARGALYPRLTLTGSAGRVSDQLEDLLESDFSVWSLAAGVLQPIFQGGRLRAGVELAEARLWELAHAWAQSALDAFAEVELALAAETFLAERLGALELAESQALEAQRLAEDRYDRGLVDYLDVLQAQRDARNAQSARLAVARELLTARVNLHLALGGGFQAPPRPRTTDPETPSVGPPTAPETASMATGGEQP